MEVERNRSTIGLFQVLALHFYLPLRDYRIAKNLETMNTLASSFWMMCVWRQKRGLSKHCRLIVVHVGLEKYKGIEEQLKRLKFKDTSIPKVEALSGRKSVGNIPQELRETNCCCEWSSWKASY